jgi:hypothetical protein
MRSEHPTTVALGHQHRPMQQSLAEAAEAGFELVERTCRTEWVHGWARGDDERWLCFLTRGEALRQPTDPHRVGVFAQLGAGKDLARRSAVPGPLTISAPSPFREAASQAPRVRVA